MPLNLNVEITSPMTADDHELLSGVSVMLLAIANHELAKEKFPEAFGGDETPIGEPVGPAPCRMENRAGSTCIREEGHRGRHTFLPAPSPESDPSLVN